MKDTGKTMMTNNIYFYGNSQIPWTRTPAGNSTFEMGWVYPMINRDRLHSADSFVATESSVLLMNNDSYWDAENPLYRKLANL